MTTIVPVPRDSAHGTRRRPGRLLKAVVYSVAALLAGALLATLILVAINGNFWGLLTIPAGTLLGVALWYVGRLLEARRQRSLGRESTES